MDIDAENGQQHSANRLTDWNAERQFLGRFYLSQGFDARQQISNDCGPASLAMVINLLLFQADYQARPLDKQAVLDGLRAPFWQRLPAWLPNVGGAIPPWGLATAFNHFAARLDLDWRAERKSHARRAHVLEQLMIGKPVTALKIWKDGGAHWVNLLRYTSQKERLYFLDPNPYLEYLSPEKRLQSQSWADFEADWSRKAWWSRWLGIQTDIIVYNKIS